jgi:hypothetical protein
VASPPAPVFRTAKQINITTKISEQKTSTPQIKGRREITNAHQGKNLARANRTKSERENHNETQQRWNDIIIAADAGTTARRSTHALLLSATPHTLEV